MVKNTFDHIVTNSETAMCRFSTMTFSHLLQRQYGGDLCAEITTEHWPTVDLTFIIAKTEHGYYGEYRLLLQNATHMMYYLRW